MSCLDVLYQPYSAQVIHGKYPTLYSQKQPDITSSSQNITLYHSMSQRKSTPTTCSPMRNDFGEPSTPSEPFSGFNPNNFGIPTSNNGIPQCNPESSSSSSLIKPQAVCFSSCTQMIQTSEEPATKCVNPHGVSRSASVNTVTKFSETCPEKLINSMQTKIQHDQVNSSTSDIKSIVTASQPCSDTPAKYTDCCVTDSSNANRSFFRPKKHKSPAAHRINSRCVMFNYFDGDTRDEVEEHFNRALSQGSKTPRKELLSSMNKRNFPPSFWNSEYQQPRSLTKRKVSSYESRPLLMSINRTASFPSFLSNSQTCNFDQTFTGYLPSSPINLSCKFDPYQSTRGFSGFQDHLQQSVTAAAAAAANASRNIGDSWSLYAGLPTTISGQNLYSHRMMSAAAAAVPDLYGFSAAAVAAAANHSLDKRYNSLLLQPSSLVKPNLSLPSNLGCPPADMAKTSSNLWPIANYTGFRF